MESSGPGPRAAVASSIANVPDFLLAGKDPSRTALHLLDRDHSYGDLQSASRSVALFLIARGVAKGDRLIVLAENSFFWVAAYLGILRAGAVCVPLPATISPEELEYIVSSTAPAGAFVQADLHRKHSSRFNGLVVMDRPPDEPKAASVAVFGDVLSLSADKDQKPLPQIAADDLASLMYTSGSTARPRGVMVTHRNIIANTASIVEYLGLTSADRILAVLPFHYCFGTSLLHTHLRAGGSIVVENRFRFPETVVKRMAEAECTGFAGVPSHYQILLTRSSLGRTPLPRLRYVQQAGGHLAPSFVQQLRQSLPDVKVFVMYGQTEATARLAYMPPEMLDSKPGSIGKAIPGVTLRVLNDAGEQVAPGETGEIVAEGDNITAGYWQDPEESAAIFRDGRLHTGDIATVDADGYIFIVDRAKDFVKVGGKRVSCRKVEEQLLEFKDLAEIAVIGVPDPVAGEALKAFVVARDPSNAGFDEAFRAFCRERLPFDILPREIVRLPSLPRNSAGKVVKQELKGR